MESFGHGPLGVGVDLGGRGEAVVDQPIPSQFLVCRVDYGRHHGQGGAGAHRDGHAAKAQPDNSSRGEAPTDAVPEVLLPWAGEQDSARLSVAVMPEKRLWQSGQVYYQMCDGSKSTREHYADLAGSLQQVKTPPPPLPPPPPQYTQTLGYSKISPGDDRSSK